MRVTVTGATGLIGSKLVAALRGRGDHVTVLTRRPDAARATLGDVEAHAWDLDEQVAPAAALEGRDAVVHLAGENVGQRWGGGVKEQIRESRRLGTGHLVDGLRAVPEDRRPATLVSASASGYYGPRGDEPVTEDDPPGDDFLAGVCEIWEGEAQRATELGMRVVRVRTGIVLDAGGGALGQMLTPFKLGVGGPIAGGRQYMPWIHVDDVVGMYLAALDDGAFAGPLNASAPTPVTNREFSRALGRALRRPAFSPVPGLALKALYGEMSEIVTTGVRMIPGRAAELGYDFRHTEVEAALRAALGR